MNHYSDPWRRFVVPVLAAMAVGMSCCPAQSADALGSKRVQQGVALTSSSQEVSFPTITAATAIVIDRDSGAVLGAKNADTLRPNPSTTKIMTALIAIERNGASLDEIVGPVSAKAADTYGSTMNLDAGDSLSLRDLLYGLMLPSGNDAGVAIAEWIGGTEDAFVTLMNERAQSLGLTSTS